MEKYIAIAIAIVVTVVLGSTLLMGDTNSVKSTLQGMMTTTTQQITELTEDLD